MTTVYIIASLLIPFALTSHDVCMNGIDCIMRKNQFTYTKGKPTLKIDQPSNQRQQVELNDDNESNKQIFKDLHIF